MADLIPNLLPEWGSENALVDVGDTRRNAGYFNVTPLSYSDENNFKNLIAQWTDTLIRPISVNNLSTLINTQEQLNFLRDNNITLNVVVEPSNVLEFTVDSDEVVKFVSNDLRAVTLYEQRIIVDQYTSATTQTTLFNIDLTSTNAYDPSFHIGTPVPIYLIRDGVIDGFDLIFLVDYRGSEFTLTRVMRMNLLTGIFSIVETAKSDNTIGVDNFTIGTNRIFNTPTRYIILLRPNAGIIDFDDPDRDQVVTFGYLNKDGSIDDNSAINRGFHGSVSSGQDFTRIYDIEDDQFNIYIAGVEQDENLGLRNVISVINKNDLSTVITHTVPFFNHNTTFSINKTDTSIVLSGVLTFEEDDPNFDKVRLRHVFLPFGYFNTARILNIEDGTTNEDDFTIQDILTSPNTETTSTNLVQITRDIQPNNIFSYSGKNCILSNLSNIPVDDAVNPNLNTVHCVSLVGVTEELQTVSSSTSTGFDRAVGQSHFQYRYRSGSEVRAQNKAGFYKIRFTNTPKYQNTNFDVENVS